MQIKKNQLESIDHGRIPPHSIDLEVSVLGSILVEKDAFLSVMDILKPECFYIEAHQIIFQVMVGMAEKHEPIDLLTIAEELKVRKVLDQVGGHFFLMKLTKDINTSNYHNIAFHARILFQKYIQREVIKISYQMIQFGYDDSRDIFQVIEESVNELISYLDTKSSKPKAIRDILDGVISDTKSYMDNLSTIKLKLSYKRLNKVFDISAKRIIFIASIPKHGKTRLMTNLIRDMFAHNENVSMFWKPMEDGSDDVTRHLIAIDSKVDSETQQSKQGNIDQNTFDKISNAADNIRNYDIEIDDEREAISYIKLKYMNFIRNRKDRFCLLVIDNFNVCADQEFGTRLEKEEKVASEIQNLNNIANQDGMKTCIIVLDHLHKELLKDVNVRNAYRPRTNNLKGASRKYEIITQLVTLNGIYKHKDVIAQERTKDDIILHGNKVKRENILKKLMILETTDSRYGDTSDDISIIRLKAELGTATIEEWDELNREREDSTKPTYVEREWYSPKKEYFEKAFSGMDMVGNYQDNFAAFCQTVGNKMHDGNPVSADYLAYKYRQYVYVQKAISDSRGGEYKRTIVSFKKFCDEKKYEETFEDVSNMDDITRDKYLYNI